jgi:hypothetical protein
MSAKREKVVVHSRLLKLSMVAAREGGRGRPRSQYLRAAYLKDFLDQFRSLKLYPFNPVNECEL